MPPTLRNMALLNICPVSLQQTLMTQPQVATGKIPFNELEGLIMTSVHRQGAKGLNNVELVGPTKSEPDGCFEMEGELYKLELRDGKNKGSP